MKKDLKSAMWPELNEKMGRYHHAVQNHEEISVEAWKNAFDSFVEAIKDERSLDPSFATEFANLSKDTEIEYKFEDILEEYFDHLELIKEWDIVIECSYTMIGLFKWENKNPSEYYFRIGNAYEQSKRFDEAEKFGAEWLEKYPDDIFAAFANVFLKYELKKTDEAKELTKKYLRKALGPSGAKDTLFDNALKIYSLTDNVYAKNRIMTKLAEFQEYTNN